MQYMHPRAVKPSLTTLGLLLRHARFLGRGQETDRRLPEPSGTKPDEVKTVMSGELFVDKENRREPTLDADAEKWRALGVEAAEA